MDYDRELVEEILDELGEVMFVLESDREYEVHSGNVTLHKKFVEAEGVNDESGDYEVVYFGYDVIEHHKTHKAL